MWDKAKSFVKDVVFLPLGYLLWVVVISMAAIAVATFCGTDIIPFWDVISSPTVLQYGVFVDKVATLMYTIVGVYIILWEKEYGEYTLVKNIKPLILCLYPSAMYRSILRLQGMDWLESMCQLQLFLFLAMLSVLGAKTKKGRRIALVIFGIFLIWIVATTLQS